MPSQPLISVIIATYNRQAYVCDAIDSVLSQTYPNIELIVIDDGSTDGTAPLLQQRYGQRIQYVYQENKGRSEARNQGMRLATGEYFAFLDSDDMWKPNKLAQQLEFMLSNPQYGLTHTLIDNVRENQDNLDVSYTRLTNTAYQQAMRRGYDYLGMSRNCTMFWSTVLVRADLARSIGSLDTTCETYEDWDWYLRAALVTSIGTLTLPLVWYRIHADNSSSEQFNNGQQALAHKHLKLSESLPFHIQLQAKRNFFLQLASVAYRRENLTECATWVHHALKLDPLLVLKRANWTLVLTILIPKSIVLVARRLHRFYAKLG